jgi:hypothetical protein
MKLEQVRDMGDPSNGQQPMGLLDFAHELTQKMKGYKVSVSKMFTTCCTSTEKVTTTSWV